MTPQELRAQLVADSDVLQAYTQALSFQFAQVLHRWAEQQKATPTLVIPTSRLDFLYKELKNVAKLGLLTLDIVKLIDKGEAAEVSKASPPDPPFANPLS